MGKRGRGVEEKLEFNGNEAGQGWIINWAKWQTPPESFSRTLCLQVCANFTGNVLCNLEEDLHCFTVMFVLVYIRAQHWN